MNIYEDWVKGNLNEYLTEPQFETYIPFKRVFYYLIIMLYLYITHDKEVYYTVSYSYKLFAGNGAKPRY